ncbi:MAG: N-6 DNA methylase [Deltaproteobacteria bacterium]|nr:N-6 DNA methylase [Deltaproteobacteria bacterium]
MKFEVLPVQYSEVKAPSEALGQNLKINRSQNGVSVPNVSERCGYVFEDQLSLDLKSCQKIETGKIDVPSHQEAIEKDFHYALKNLIELIHQDVDAQKEILLSLNPSRKKNIAQELENIISELNDFKPLSSIQPEKLDELVYASFESLPGRGLSVFCSRAAHFTTLRLMLVHYWKTIGLTQDSERNPYKDPNLAINQVLNKSCANLIKEKHNWLFAKQNNYSWYKMSLDTLNEIENIFAYWEFKEESISLLSFVYERYLDENRLRKYAHYTPPLLVRFIWDLLMKHSQESTLFRMMGKNRVPKLIFDPTMGSGNFLIEAAQRMKEELAQEKDPQKRAKEYSLALTSGLFGCDIDSFAHFFSEIKMLWMMSSLIKNTEKVLLHQKTNLSLSIIHQNALKLYTQGQLEMIPQDPEEPLLALDTKFGLMPLEGHLKTVHSKIKLLEKFDVCMGCPPEKILKEQKDFLKELIQKAPYWKQHYENNLLYSSWFFVLGLSKLREGGKLIFITETYWPTEEGASRLRHHVLQEAKVLAILDLGHILIEEDTTPLPRYITLLSKCSSKEERERNKIKIIKVRPQENPVTAAFILGKLKQILSFKTTLNYFCAMEENSVPPQDTLALMTPEVALHNQFLPYEKREDSGNLVTFLPKPICKESPYYLLTLLNSPVLNFWYANNGNKKNGKRFFDPASLKMIPIRPIHFSSPIETSIQTEKMAQVSNALSKFDAKFLMAYLSLELTHGREELVHDALVLMQKEILTLQKTLEKYDQFFEFKISTAFENQLPPTYRPLAFRAVYPLEKQCALKDHKKIFIQKDTTLLADQFCLVNFKHEEGVKNEGEHLTLLSKENKTIQIYGPAEMLIFIETDLKKQSFNFWDEIEASIFLPKDIEEFEAFKEEIISHGVKQKLKQLQIQKVSNQIIYKLYGFNIDDPDPLKSKEAQAATTLMDTSCY